MAIAAAIQMCSSTDIDENLSTAQKLIHEAAQHGAKLIVLPETFALLNASHTSKITTKEKIDDGKIQSFLSQQAKSTHTWIVGGTLPIACESPHKVRAACLLYNDLGQRVARYDKIHLFDVVLSENESYLESATIEPGNEMVVTDTPFGKIGFAICYDLRFPELFRCLFDQGAEIIIIPCAFTQPTGAAHFETLVRSRAIENFCYVIAACQGGTHSSGRKTFGHSIIVEPWGEVIAKKDNAEPGIIYAELDLHKVYEARKKIPIKEHRRI